MKDVKGWLKFIFSLAFTVMVIAVLFVVIFVVFDGQEPDASFWIELIAT